MRHSPNRSRIGVVWICVSSALAYLGCDKRTPEEKGKSYAEEKLGYAQGAAKVLSEKGKGIGESAGKGVGELVKGVGSAVKDTIHPPVEVTLTPDLTSAGISVLRAHEKEDGANSRNIAVHVQFQKAFAGRLRLDALTTQGNQGSASAANEIVQAANTDRVVDFSFPKDMRLSKIERYALSALMPKSVGLAPAFAPSSVELSQLQESGTKVTVYARFVKAFTGALELRAYDAGGAEIGRSEPTSAIAAAVDSARYLDFVFDPRTPMDRAERYVLHTAKPKPNPDAG